MTASTLIYRAAARTLARLFLAGPGVRTVSIRRSVAAGEASFPWSDLDLAIVMDEPSGEAMLELRRRFRRARAAFPRLGECQVFTPEDLREIAATDPYRSSLDRRFGVTVWGEPPEIPVTPLPPLQAARRLVFWFERFVPWAMGQGSRRNQRKFALEMANALGVLEGRWAEPLARRDETARRWGRLGDDWYGACFELAARAHRQLRPPAPRLSRPLALPGLLVVPSASEAPRDGSKAVTPEVLDLLLQTQNPWLWRENGDRLAEAGFEEPSQWSWMEAARRWAAGERLRGPGFLESGAEAAVSRLNKAARILGRTPPVAPDRLTLESFYLEAYDEFRLQAAALREEARRRTPSAKSAAT
ncbi:MAG: hypothetical protein GC160_20270 [Acidobacteria bacterium]|nr:hypothetical protein [Acidobacteriota bacterium]